MRKMKKTVAGVLLFVWILIGAALGFYFYQSFTSATGDEMKNRVAQIQTYSKNTNEVLDKLPRIFKEAPATAVILILNQKSKLLGSLYEPARIRADEYDSILKSYKNIELKNFTYQRLPFAGGYSIWVISRKNVSALKAFEFVLGRNPGLILFPIVYAFGLIIILMILLIDPARGKTPETVGEKSSEKTPKEISKKEIPQPRSKERQARKSEAGAGEPESTRDNRIIVSNPFISNKILLLMDTIEKNFSTNTIAFYSRESGKWKHVLEKTGNLSIRGDAAVENLPREILSLSDNSWREPLLSQDQRLLYIPLHYRNLLFGLLRLEFTGLASQLDHQLLDRLIGLCTRYSDSLFMQRVYDKAVADPETDFYNYPYFYFMVREKLGSSKKFAVVVFEIADLGRITPETTRSWAHDLIVELNKKHLKPMVSARLDRTKFSLLYELKGELKSELKSSVDENVSEPRVEKEGDKVDLMRLDEVPEIIQNVTLKSFKQTAKLTGGFFIRPTNYEDAESFMQRLDYLLINSSFNAYPSDFTGKFSGDHLKAAV